MSVQEPPHNSSSFQVSNIHLWSESPQRKLVYISSWHQIDLKTKGNTIELGIQITILQKSSTCPPNPYYLVWSTIYLSPPPQRIWLFSSPFHARRFYKIQTFPSIGEASHVHVSTTRRASLAISVKLRCSHQEVGCITFTYLQRTRWTSLWGVSSSRLNNALGVLCRGVSCVHGSTTRQASVSISVSI